MKKYFVTIFFSVIALFGFISAKAAPVEVYFFFGDGCPHCAKVEPIIDYLEKEYPDVLFSRYEVYRNKENARLMFSLYGKYGVPKERQGAVPIVFVGDSYLIGDRSIIDNLEGRIRALIPTWEESKIEIVVPEETPSVAESVPATTTQTKEEISPPTKEYSLWAITAAAAVDSINPCAIAVLLILLTALMIGSNDKKRALFGALAFTSSIYLAYLLFGLGILQLINVTGLAGIVGKIIGVVAILIGLANLKDYFFYGKGGFVMEIPLRWRPTLKKLLRGITSPLGAFFIGFIVTLFELPCTGGPYFFVIGLLSQTQSVWSVMPVLLYYNLVFVVPLLAITFLVYFGFTSIEHADKWKEKNIKVLHLIAGVIMLALGVWAFFM
jgi:cytochrome c biogenesis protein CcdA/glutaredoxin